MAFKKKEFKRVDFEDEEPDFSDGEEMEEEETPVKQPQKEKKVLQSSHFWEVKEVPVETQKVLYNSKTDKSYDIYNALALILNKIEE